MCLYIKSGPHKAKKDIYTLKAAEKVTLEDCESFYQSVIQVYGELQKSILYECYDDSEDKDIIENGLHSIIGDYHNTIVHKHLIRNHNGVILCKIPKGSTYYIGTKGDIVSDKLILIEPIIAGNYLLNNIIWEDIRMPEALELAEKIVNSYGIKIGL